MISSFFKGLGPNVVLLVLFLFVFSCKAGSGLAVKELRIMTGTGEVSLAAEVAEKPEQRQRGLMFRKELADGKGMLFVFERDQMLSFWMKNTIVPLSIAFIASDGRIVELHDMEPQSLATVQSRRSCRYALEVPQGWFQRSGVAIGDRVTW